VVAFRRVKGLFRLVFFACAYVLGVANASAEEARADARDVLARAESDDAAFAFDKALAGYDEVLRLDPTILQAEQRATMIRARSEGGFEPLVTLERIRRDPRLASDAGAIDALVEAANTFPPGLVRVEAWVLAAEAYARRLGREADALPLWQRIASDPAAGPGVVQSAVRRLATARLARGEWAEAEATTAMRGAEPKLVDDVRRGVRRHRLHLASVGVLVAVLGLAALTIVRARRASQTLRRTGASARVVLGYAAYVAIAGAVLAAGYEQGRATPFLVFGIVLVPLLFIARAWGAAGSTARLARAGRAALCASGVIGAAFLVLERIDVAYLEGFGL
jgi:hypothetical protein